MDDNRFNDEWDTLPEGYKRKFVEVLEERGLAKDFDSLSDEYKSQILEIIKEVFREIASPSADEPPVPDSSKT